VLIGEHDNPDHHRLQLELSGDRRAGRRPAVAMEQFDQQAPRSIARAGGRRRWLRRAGQFTGAAGSGCSTADRCGRARHDLLLVAATSRAATLAVSSAVTTGSARSVPGVSASAYPAPRQRRRSTPQCAVLRKLPKAPPRMAARLPRAMADAVARRPPARC
jgi:hypothetical protein